MIAQQQQVDDLSATAYKYLAIRDAALQLEMCITFPILAPKSQITISSTDYM